VQLNSHQDEKVSKEPTVMMMMMILGDRNVIKKEDKI